MSRRRAHVPVVVVAVGVAVAASAAVRALGWPVAPLPETRVTDRPIEVAHSGYVSSRTCRACHPQQYATWRASYHRTMTQIARPEALAGPFDGVELVRAGERWSFEQRGEALWVRIGETNGGGGKPREKRIVLTTGSHHFQFYWAATAREHRPALLPWSYQIAERRWIPTDAVVLAPPGLEQTSEDGDGRWNLACNRCHATGSQPRIRTLEHMETRVAEFGIACEACHGPGGRHVAQNRDPLRRYALHFRDEGDSTIVNPARLDHRRASQVCGQCHSVNNFPDVEAQSHWARYGFPYRPGDELEDTRVIVEDDGSHNPWQETRFWPDGTALVNGREYNGLRDTPCFERGEMSCLSCHVLHPHDADPLAAWADDQLGPGMRGNPACTQCHRAFDDDAALAAHTHHAPDSAGSRCYDCHMPNTAYGLHKATRSHRLESPDVAATLATGRLGGCNLCHLDRTLEWTAGYLERWYGTRAPALPPLHRSVAASVVQVVSGDAAQRALIAWHMGWAPAQEASGADWMPPYLAQLLVDPYAATRSVAYRALRQHEGFEDFEYDFVGAPEARRGGFARAMERWRERTLPPEHAARPAVLLREDGALQRARYARLRAARDDRAVYVAE
jgi:hypothetical protein